MPDDDPRERPVTDDDVPESDAPENGTSENGTSENGASGEADAAPAEAEANGTTDGGASVLDFPVVGIGASAGGLGAFKALLEDLPEDPGMAFVVVQHLDPEHESELADLLQTDTAMPVAAAADGMAVEQDHVYVIPPGKNLSIQGGKLHLSALEPRAERAPIDYFFRSLARSEGAGAVGIVLSGTGGGGTTGLKRIKERGGLTLVQDPEEAEFAGMPRSAVRMGLVDEVAPVAALAQKLVQYCQAMGQIQPPQDGEALQDGEEEALREVFALLRKRTGQNFSHYKRSTVLRRIGRRMQINQVETLPAYLSLLRGDQSDGDESDGDESDGDESSSDQSSSDQSSSDQSSSDQSSSDESSGTDEGQALARDLLITVTNFFRDTEAFETLKAEVIPGLFEGKGVDDTVRVWAAGCATGEEAYSLAILLREYAATLDGPAPQLQVFATDVGEGAIQSARAGLYAKDIVGDLSEQRLNRFFHEESGGYRVRSSLRDLVVFARHDLLNDAPFSRIDLIACRNLLIYLKQEVQERVFDVFYYALRPGGSLFLGSAESVGQAKRLFHTLDKKHCLYRRREDVSHRPHFGDMPFMQSATSRKERAAMGRGRKGKERHPPDFDDVRRQVLEQYAPPGIIVNEEHDIAHVFAGANPYLRYAAGAPTHRILEVILPPLRSALRSALFEAQNEQREVQSRSVSFEQDGRRRRVRLVVQPVGDSGFLQVVFLPSPQAEPGPAEAAPADAAPADATDGEAAPPSEADEAQTEEAQTEEDALVDQLEAELRDTRGELQGTVEEYESTTEKLRASNEELQSMNEELRSTTEELETSKEELQSINEELTTVNQELESKNDELDRVNGDLRNLLASTQIATLFLDRELRLQRYTPRATDVFHVIESDRGRPIKHVTRRFDYADLAEDAARVLKDLTPVEREVHNDADRWFMMRVRPYRTFEDKIDGVVVTFIDVTERRHAREVLREARDYAQNLINTVREPLLVLNADLRVQSANRSFYDTFHGRRADTEGALIYEVNQGAWDLPELRRLLGEVLPANERFDDFVVEHDFEQAGYRKMVLNARQVRHADLILLAIEDVTERQEMTEALRRGEERQRLIMENVQDYALFTLDADGRVDSWGPGAAQTFGYAEREILSEPVDVLFTEQQRAEGVPVAELREARETGETAAERWMQRKDGTRFWAAGVTSRLERPSGWLRGYSKILRDDTERKHMEERLAARVAERTREVRRLASQLTMAEQHERRRLAGILHEDIQQLLYGAEMTVRRLRRALPAEGEPFTAALLQEKTAMLDQVEDVLGHSVEATRSLARELSPPELHDTDLGSTLRWLADHMQERYGLAVEVRLPEALPPVESRDLHTLLFRLVRELLFNVVKHAGTDRATLTAHAEEGRLLLTVADAGVGFDPAALEGHRYGLSGMRERLQLLDGRLKVESRPGEGTRVRVALPVASAGEAD